MIDASLLVNRVTFYRAETERNEFGEEVQRWVPVCQTRARCVYKRGARALEMGEIWVPNTVSVLLRWRKGLDERMRFSWRNRFYQIESFFENMPEGRIDIVGNFIPGVTDDDIGEDNG